MHNNLIIKKDNISIIFDAEGKDLMGSINYIGEDITKNFIVRDINNNINYPMLKISFVNNGIQEDAIYPLILNSLPIDKKDINLIFYFTKISLEE